MESEANNIVLSPINSSHRKDRSKTTERITYETEANVIKSQIGDLEDIRFRLGLSARKMAQLLMVDPSAWSRWCKKITPPPPHIYRALQWYLILQEKNPGFTPQVFLANRWHSSQLVKSEDNNLLQDQIKLLNQKIVQLEMRDEARLNTLNEKNEALKSFRANSKLVLWGSLFVGVILGALFMRLIKTL